jgi:glycosyltransferase involved in cell wall biosynthesis
MKGELPEEKSEGFLIKRLSFKEMFSKKTYTSLDIAIYHSQNQNLITLLAELFEPKKKHVITCRDPRNFYDWCVEFRYATLRRKLKTPISYLFEEGLIGTLAVRKADVVGVPAYFLKQKVKKMHFLKKEPLFLPNIEEIPVKIPSKSKTLTVCYIGRLEKRKRPEIVLSLAEKFPLVTFNIIGTSEEKKRYDYLKSLAPKNVIFKGELNKFTNKEFFKTIDKSWILINTAAREGLPVSFVEAGGRGCAILSYVNPDDFALQYGYHAKELDFEKGLHYLLEKNKWKQLGKKGHDYVYANYRKEQAIKKHIGLYTKMLLGKK